MKSDVSIKYCVCGAASLEIGAIILFNRTAVYLTLQDHSSSFRTTAILFLEMVIIRSVIMIRMRRISLRMSNNSSKAQIVDTVWARYLSNPTIFSM